MLTGGRLTSCLRETPTSTHPPNPQPLTPPCSYHKLMLRRIDWTQKAEPKDGDPLAAAADDEDDEEDERPAGSKPNACHLVWEGVVKESSFKEFSRQEVADTATARALLERKGVAHYWDAAANFDPSAAPLPSAVM